MKISRYLDSFVSELITDAQFYSQLVAPAQGDSEALTLRDLGAIGITQQLPLLMAVKTSGKVKEFPEAIELVETLTMRYLIVGNQNPNQLERKYSEWAITFREHKSLDKIHKGVTDLLSQSPDFETGFLQLAELPAAQVRYILRKIEEYKTTREFDLAWKAVNIEHILPQTPSQEWIDELAQDEEELEEMTGRLGNLTLLAERLNKSASNKAFNKAFKVKVEQYYKKSKVRITNELQNYGRWDEDSIKQRQEEYASIAKDIWGA